MKQKPCETYQSAQTPEGPRTVCITCGRVRRVHKGKHNRKPRAPKKHKLTRKSLYNWAVRQAKANPTYNENRWNPEKGEHVMETLPNSAQRELAMLLWGNFACEIGEYKASEARELLRDFAWDGTVGYKTMGVEALLDELFDMCENYGGFGDTEDQFAYVEDVVNHCNRW